MKNLNVLLLNSFSLPLCDLNNLLSLGSDLRVPDVSLPLGITSLASYGRAHLPNTQFAIIDANKELHAFFLEDRRTHTDLASFIAHMLSSAPFAPDVVGVSNNFSTGHTSSLMLADQIRKLFPNAVVVFGGVHVTNFSRRFIEHPSVDYVIRGAAEKGFTAFLTALGEGKPVEGIPGVVSDPDKADTVCEPVAGFSELPMLAYDLVDMEYYIRHDTRCILRGELTRPVPMQFSRGCPFKCTFCVGATVHGRKMMLKDNDTIMRELNHLRTTYSINTIIVEDDLFGVNKPAFYDLCDRLESSGLGFKFIFPNALSVAVLDEHMIDRLCTIGLESAILAIESGSREVQRRIIKKNCNLDKAVRLSKYFRTKGIPIMAYFILGFPRETRDLMAETVAFARTMELDWAYFLMAAPLMGSEMCQELLDRGTLTEERLLDVMNNTDFSKRIFDTPEISAADLMSFSYDANIDVNFVNSFNMRHGNFERAVHRFNSVINNYPFHVVALACRSYCYDRMGKTELAKTDRESIQRLVQEHPEAKRLYDHYEKFIAELTTTKPAELA